MDSLNYHQLQDKINQEIAILDDEIDRKTKFLKEIQSEITATDTAIENYSRENFQNKDEIDYQNKTNKAYMSTKIAQLKAEQARKIENLVTQYENEIQNLDDDYQRTLSEIETWAENKYKSKINSIELEIQNAQSFLDKLTEDKYRAMFTYEQQKEDEILEFENSQIQKLNSNLEEKKAILLESLQYTKSQLDQAVSTLENLEKEHTQKIEEFQAAIVQIDNHYKSTIENETSSHNSAILKLKQELQNLKDHNAQMTKDVLADENNFKEQYSQLMNESNLLKTTLTSFQTKSSVYIPSSQFNETKINSQKLDELKAKLCELDIKVKQERNKNAYLQREIRRIKSEAIIAKRRLVLIYYNLFLVKKNFFFCAYFKIIMVIIIIMIEITIQIVNHFNGKTSEKFIGKKFFNCFS